MPEAQAKRPARGANSKPAGNTEKAERGNSKRRGFAGTENPRHLRILAALLTRARPREELDRIAGASNGPHHVMELRGRGLEIPCARTPCYDRDGHEVKRGIYWATERDRRRIRAWQRRRDAARGRA